MQSTKHTSHTIIHPFDGQRPGVRFEPFPFVPCRRSRRLPIFKRRQKKQQHPSILASAEQDAVKEMGREVPVQPSVTPKELQIGMTVRVKGLQARPELNGLEGVLTFREEEKGRWKVELKNGGGAKLFKDANLEPYISDKDALNILRAEVKEDRRPPVRAEAPSPVPSVPVSTPVETKVEAERPKSFLERSRAAEAGAQVSAAAVAAAAAVAKVRRMRSEGHCRIPLPTGFMSYK
eukprot:s2282_g12.t2